MVRASIRGRKRLKELAKGASGVTKCTKKEAHSLTRTHTHAPVSSS